MLVIGLLESLSDGYTLIYLDALKKLSRSYKVSMESMLTCSKDEMHGTIAACSELQDDSILQLSFAICFGSYLLVDVYTGD